MNPLRPGVHTVELGGMSQRYHVRGRGSQVCVALPGGPGVQWDYLRMPAVEQRMTVVYVEPLGTGQSGRLPGAPPALGRARQPGRPAGTGPGLVIPACDAGGASAMLWAWSTCPECRDRRWTG